MTRGAVILAGLAASLAAQTTDPAKIIEELEKELAAHVRLLADWAGLTRYGSENSEIALKSEPNRVVFLGDEITEMWGQGAEPFFPGKPYLNRGITGQTTPQMLVRFRQDVVSLKPRVVVIQGGSNDYAGNAGPATAGTISENIMTMTELAKVHGIRVVLVSLTPVCDCSKAAQGITLRRPHGRMLGLNEWMKEYAEKSGVGVVDLYSALAQGRVFKRELTADGLIPSDAGYRVMGPLVEREIARVSR